jgi:hypothetical protein
MECLLLLHSWFSISAAVFCEISLFYHIFMTFSGNTETETFKGSDPGFWLGGVKFNRGKGQDKEQMRLCIFFLNFKI